MDEITDYLWLAEAIAAKFRKDREPRTILFLDSEILGDAYVGLCKAAKQWRSDSGLSFKEFAAAVVTHEVKDGLYVRNRLFGLGTSRKDRINGRTGRCLHVPKIRSLSRWHADNSDPKKDYENRDQCEILLKRCTLLRRQRLHKRFWLGMRQDEIAAYEGITESAVSISMRQSFEVMRA